MAPEKKKRQSNTDYCRRYRAKNAEKYNAADRERKQRERDRRKFLGPKDEYKSFKDLLLEKQ